MEDNWIDLSNISYDAPEPTLGDLSPNNLYGDGSEPTAEEPVAEKSTD